MTDERSAPPHLPRRLFGVQRQAAEEAIAEARARAEDAEQRLAATEEQLAEAQRRAAETRERLSSFEASAHELVEKARQRVQEFEGRLREAERELSDLRRRESVVGAALIHAEKVAQDSIMGARNEAEAIVAEARARADEMLADAERRRDDVVEFAESVRLRTRRMLEGTIGELERTTEAGAARTEHDVGRDDPGPPLPASVPQAPPPESGGWGQAAPEPPQQTQRPPEPSPFRPAAAGPPPLEASPPGDRTVELECAPVPSAADVADLERRIVQLPGVRGVRIRSHQGARVTFMVGVDGGGLDVGPLLGAGAAELESASGDRIVLNLTGA